jgi:hypothetical protein
MFKRGKYFQGAHPHPADLVKKLQFQNRGGGSE